MGVKKRELPLISNFESSFIDFKRGIRVGHLEPSQRITQLIKELLVARHGVEMVCDRWGRGVYWQWICWVPRPNREAKPLSSGYNFSSAKFFVSVDRDEQEFVSGMQIERAPKRPASDDMNVSLQKDWDWNVMLAALKKKALPRAISALLQDGFRLRVGPFSALSEFDDANWNAKDCSYRASKIGSGEWGVFQLFYAIPENEVHKTNGAELIEAVAGVFDEVTEAMNLCMYAPCLKTTFED